MSKDENMHSLILRKDVLHPVTFFLQCCVSSGALFSFPVPLLACVLRLQGFARNKWVMGKGTFAVYGYGFVQLCVGISACWN